MVISHICRGFHTIIGRIISYTKRIHTKVAFGKATPSEIPEIEKSPKPIISTKVNVTFLEKHMSKTDVIIKGIIKNNELINVLNRLNQFEENIKRIITTSIDREVDIFIELEMDAKMMKTFKENVGELGWKINS